MKEITSIHSNKIIIYLISQNGFYLQGNKFKTCDDVIKIILHTPSTEVECVALFCLGDQLPPPCGPHHVILAAGPVLWSWSH